MSDGTAELLRAFLDGRDTACPACGYNLRNLQGSRCPECGDELALRVGLVEPRQGALIAGLIGLAAGAGLSGLLILYVMLTELFHRLRGPDARFWYLTIGGFLVEGAAIVLWLRLWRRIRRLPASTKSLLVAGCWTLTFLNLIVFTMFIR